MGTENVPCGVGTGGQVVHGVATAYQVSLLDESVRCRNLRWKAGGRSVGPDDLEEPAKVCNDELLGSRGRASGGT